MDCHNMFLKSMLYCCSKWAELTTKIPYFVIRKQDMKYDGMNPTLVDAYGGFEISMLPYYSATVGAAWLEMGAVKVVGK